MIVRCVLFLILLFPAIAWAQGPPYRSDDQRFEVNEKRGCAPFTLTITNTDLKGPVIACGTCFIDWGDGQTGNSSVLTHTYTTPGNYRLTITYQGPPGPDQIDITAVLDTIPQFEVYTCSNNEVQVRVLDNSYDSYFIDFGDGNPEIETPRGSLPVTYSYATSGDYTISVQGSNAFSARNCTPGTRDVTVSTPAPVAPIINQISITSNSVIDLQMTAPENVLYRLEVQTNTGSFQNFGTMLNVNTRAITGLNTDNNYYCVQVGALNPCSGGSPQYSSIICSADLAATAQNNQNELTWVTSMAGINNFSIDRNSVILPSTPTSSPFIDNINIVCGTNYCYRLISNYASGSRSISAERCVTAFSTDIPTAIANVATVVNGNSVDLTWQPDATFTAQTYEVLRRPSGGTTFTSLDNGITLPAYTDDQYASSRLFCYQIEYTDACGNTSNDVVACPIVLSFSTSTSGEITLTWEEYTGYENGVDHYEVDKYSLQHEGPETFIVPPGPSPFTFTDTNITDQGYYYVVRAIPVDDAFIAESVSNEVLAVKGLKFAYPKAFTPDQQGPEENETFRVFVIQDFIAAFEMKIFNRWGEMIYTTTDLAKGWDGKFNGQPQPEGNYTFTATLKDKTGRTFKRDGSVMLLRKK